ncbi:MAG: hypothetical protein IBX69_09250 [Anaerolineales bacterium]|nr:hypothetical protein [Anaerolineales bacterium]
MGNLQALFGRFTAAYRAELRFLVRTWSYPLLHLLWLGLLFYAFLGSFPDDRSALVLLETSLGRVAIGITSLLALFVAGISATRVQRLKLAELEASFPTGLETLIGRWLAGVTAVGSFLIEPLVVAAYQGPAASFWAGAPIFIGEALLTIAFTTATAWWLNSWLKLGRWAYPLLVAGWAVLFLIPNMLYNIYKPLLLLNFMRQGTINVYSELFGRLIYADLFMYFNLFYMGLLGFILGLISWLHSSHRFHRRSIKAGSLIVVALSIAGFGGWGYLQIVEAEENQGASQWSVGAVFEEQDPIGTKRHIVEEYDLKVDLSEGENSSFQVRMSVRNPQPVALEELYFYLYPDLEVTDSSLPVERAGEIVRLFLKDALQPGEKVEVHISYRGRVWHTESIRGIPVAMDFIHDDGVRLSPGIGWYPLPAAGIDPGSSDLSRTKPSRVHLKVSGNKELNFGSNLPKVAPGQFYSEDATWIFLVGSPQLVTEQIGQTTLITSKNDLPRVRGLIDIYTEPLGKMRLFFPDLQIDGLTLIVLGEESGLPLNTPPSDNRPVVVISRWVLAGIDQQQAGDYPQHMVWNALMYDLWDLYTTETSPGDYWISDDIVRFIWAYHQTGGEPQVMKIMVEEISYRGLDIALVKVYEQFGIDGVVQVLDQVREHRDELVYLGNQELQDWISGEAAAGLSP